MSIIFKFLYSVWLLFLAASWIFTHRMPLPSAIDRSLYNEPVQSQTASREEFDFSYRGKTYNVKPQADYELWGIVVTQNDIGAWYNYYHDENSVNLKDLCVVWGDNIRGGAYRDQDIKFKSGEWTCYYQWSRQAKSRFYPDKLSNNHLLTDNEAIQDLIRSANVGDQVHLKGSLVDYAEKGAQWYRKTSLSREDSNQTSRSGGACEVFFVDKMEILKQNQLYWNYFYRWKWPVLSAIFILQLILFLINIRKAVRKSAER